MNKPDQNLFDAVKKNDATSITDALKNGADINAKAEYGDTPLNIAATEGNLDIIKLLVEAGADINNKGSADMPPLMNAAVGGHIQTVQYLIDKGAIVSNDLISSIQLKVNILKENAEAGMVNPESIKPWEQFLNFLVASQLKQHLPEFIKDLTSSDAEDRKNAIINIEEASYQGADIAESVDTLSKYADDPDHFIQKKIGFALAAQFVRKKEWSRLIELANNKSGEIKTGVVGTITEAASKGNDLLPLLPILTAFLGEGLVNLRNDALVALGYMATNKHDISSTLPLAIKSLKDNEAPVRKMACWCLYRMGKYIGDISQAKTDLELLLKDEDAEVAEMAESALTVIEEK